MIGSDREIILSRSSSIRHLRAVPQQNPQRRRSMYPTIQQESSLMRRNIPPIRSMILVITFDETDGTKFVGEDGSEGSGFGRRG